MKCAVLPLDIVRFLVLRFRERLGDRSLHLVVTVFIHLLQHVHQAIVWILLFVNLWSPLEEKNCEKIIQM